MVGAKFLLVRPSKYRKHIFPDVWWSVYRLAYSKLLRSTKTISRDITRLRARPHAETVHHLETIPGARETVFFSVKHVRERAGWLRACAPRDSRGKGSRLQPTHVPRDNTEKNFVRGSQAPGKNEYKNGQFVAEHDRNREPVSWPCFVKPSPDFPSTNSIFGGLSLHFPRVISNFAKILCRI